MLCFSRLGRNPRLRCFWGACWFYAGFAATAPASVRASDSRILGLAGNDQYLWLFHRRAEPDGTLLLYFFSRRADAAANQGFQPLFRLGITGAVMQAAAQDDSLDVFFRDGTHRRYRRRRLVWGTPPSPAHFVERSLPKTTGSGPSLPAAIASDASSSTLLAVISTEQARALLHEAAKSQALDEDDADTAKNEDAVPAPPPAAISFRTDFVLARYESGVWHLDRDGPAELTKESRIEAMLVRNGTVHLLYQADRNEPVFVHQRCDGPAESWSAPATVPLVSAPACSAAGWGGDRPVFVVAERKKEGIVVRALTYQDGHWSMGPTLRREGSQPFFFSAPLALAVFASSAAVAVLEEGHTVKVGRWSLEDGRPIEALAEVRPNGNRPPSLMDPSTRMVMEYTILGGVLAALFLWRRGNIVLASPLDAGQRYAPLAYRVLALLFDLVILAPVWSLTLYGLWLHEGMTWSEFFVEQSYAGDRSLGALDLFPAVLGLIVAVYATVFESFGGATPGKRILGIRVVGQDGKPCRFFTILFRNLFRVVEFEFLPLALLVILTPARQRLGDIFAQTLVVQGTSSGEDASSQKQPPSEEPTSPSEETP